MFLDTNIPREQTLPLTLETHPPKSILLLKEDTQENGNDMTALHFCTEMQSKLTPKAGWG